MQSWFSHHIQQTNKKGENVVEIILCKLLFSKAISAFWEGLEIQVIYIILNKLHWKTNINSEQNKFVPTLTTTQTKTNHSFSYFSVEKKFT